MHLFRRMSCLLLAAVALFAAAAPERWKSLIDERRILPAEHPAIDYWNAEPTDPVALLQQKLVAGESALEFDDQFGYLRAVLEALEIPESSQTLVFSKTSFQASRIFPRAPRAVYHGESTAVGWVRGGDVIEVTSVDPKLGVVFYTLDQVRSPRPRFKLRSTECLSCHVGAFTLGVPGLMVRSVQPDRFGSPMRAPSFISDHRSPLPERWGGWYVSGRHGSQEHLGNVVFERGGVESSLLGERTRNVDDLKPYVSDIDYVRAGSDIVSLMVLEHQTRLTNLITRLGWETRIALHDGDPVVEAISDTAEELLRYLLFTNEAPLDDPIQGDPQFVRDFESRGLPDGKGRSLRQLDLQQRMFRYPCSYLIHSEAFRSLPAEAKEIVYRRLWEVLTGSDDSDVYANLSAEDRQAVLEILRDTQPDLPAYWD